MAFPTNPIYKFFKDVITDEVIIVKKSCGGSRYLDIPFDEANTDYQEYLAWVADGGVAEAAD